VTSQAHAAHPGHPGRPGVPARPERIGAYTLLSPLGEGGMGVVHLARHDDGRRVALKVLRPHVVGDEEGRRRLDREVSSLRRVRSRWVAEVLDADPWAPVPYVATRYVPGLSLHDHVHREGPVLDGRPGGDLTWCAAGLAEGIAAVHAAGVTHRDVKPANVLLEGRSPILIDFGLARLADDPRLTHTGYLLGTPGYLAPEILYGDDATAASDVHSWAATVAFAATGRAPFGRGPSMAVMDRVRRGEHDLAGVPDPLRSLLAAALDPEPDRRPVLDDILGWLRPRAAVARPRDAAPVVPATGSTDVEDPFTVPLALVAPSADPDGAAPATGVTEVVDTGREGDGAAFDDDAVATAHVPLDAPTRDEAPPTRVYTELARPEASPVHAAAPAQPPADPRFVDAWSMPPTYPAADVGQPAYGDPHAAPHSDAHADPYDPYADPHADPWAQPVPVPREPAAVRLRRAALLGAGIALAGAGLAAAPYLVGLVLVVVTVLLRAASAAAAGVGERRERRGRRWWDAPWALVSAPWHLLASLPSSLLLLVWSGGLGLAAALVGYAVGAPTPLVLGPAGVVVAAALWWGPGGSRVRSPLRRAATPVVLSAGATLLCVAVLLAAVVGIVLAVHGAGAVLTWAPASGSPSLPG